MIFDAFDGKVARWRKESSMLGQELDSLADSVRFPISLSYSSSSPTPSTFPPLPALFQLPTSPDSP